MYNTWRWRLTNASKGANSYKVFQPGPFYMEIMEKTLKGEFSEYSTLYFTLDIIHQSSHVCSVSGESGPIVDSVWLAGRHHKSRPG